MPFIKGFVYRPQNSDNLYAFLYAFVQHGQYVLYRGKLSLFTVSKIILVNIKQIKKKQSF